METILIYNVLRQHTRGVGDAVGVGKIQIFPYGNGYHRMRSSECLKIGIMKFTVNTPNTGNDQKKVKSSSIL